MSDISDLLERFRRGPEVLAVVLTGVFGEEEDFVPAPGKWSIRQEVAASGGFRDRLCPPHPADRGRGATYADRFRPEPGQESGLRAAQAQTIAQRAFGACARKTERAGPEG